VTTYLHDGIEFDLDGDFADVTGVVWSWTGRWSPAEEPMLTSDGPGPDLPLPDVYHYHGPLIPIRRKTLARRLSPTFAATQDAGYIERDVDVWFESLGGQR
jgi:hypothetical protein